MLLPDVRTEEPDDSQLHFVAFESGAQNFAVPIGRVKEVLPDREVTPIPEGPSLIEGMIESRGKLIAVVDLAKRLGFLRRAAASRHILVLSVGKQTIAVRVYLRDGIYADMNLVMHRGKWQSFEWSFPDFKSGLYDAALSRMRELYKEQIRGLKLS